MRSVNWKNFKKINKLFVRYLWKRIKDTMILQVASSLSYTTLIAVVPLLAVALSMFTAFPVFDDVKIQVQDFIIQYFVPNIEQEVKHYMVQFIDATTQLTAIGVLGIAVTAVLLLSTIENSFNYIFRVKTPRSIATKITLYWTIITLCPLLLGTAFSLKGYILTLKYFHPEDLMGYTLFTTIILPNLLTFGVLMLSYILVPNKKIRFSSAFAGTCVTFLFAVFLRIGFGYFLALNVTYKTLYGALATVPLLLVWMYSWWTIVLFGAVFTSALEEFRDKKRLIN
jgi:membrane protein